jgi:hypothetical protein
MIVGGPYSETTKSDPPPPLKVECQGGSNMDCAS